MKSMIHNKLEGNLTQNAGSLKDNFSQNFESIFYSPKKTMETKHICFPIEFCVASQELN